MINEPVDWEEFKNNLIIWLYIQPLYHFGDFEHDFGIRDYFNQIRSPDKFKFVTTDSGEDKVYIPTDIFPPKTQILLLILR
jgi:hypothetical protein